MDYKIKPWDHQQKSIDHVAMTGANFFALFYEMGAGKTSTLINIYRNVCNREKRLPLCLIIAPVVVLENWKREFHAHSNIQDKNVTVLHGAGKKRIKLLHETLMKNKTGVFITNTDALNMGDFWDYISEAGFEFLAVDESHKFKEQSSKRTKKMLKFCKQGQLTWRFILTGSPILNSALDIWSQYQILNPNIFDKNFYAFRSKYFYDGNAKNPHIKFPNWLMKDGAYFASIGQTKTQEDVYNDLNKIIYKYAHRVTKDEALDLPSITYQTIDVEMGPEQKRIYKEMSKDYVAFLKEPKNKPWTFQEDAIRHMLTGEVTTQIIPDAEAMTADLAIVKLLRLQQIVSGIFKSEDDEIIRLDSERNRALEALVESILADKRRKNKIIIWCVFKESYKIIGELLTNMGVAHVFLTGDQNYKQKIEAMDTFNNEPHVEIIVANQSAGGTGVNLQAANYSIYYSRNFSLEADLQSESRNHRGGQTRPCTRIDLVTTGTIDEQVLEALKNKQDIADNVLKIKV